MSKIDDGGFAFPCGPDDKAGWNAEYGMSLRDWLAGQALIGFSTWMPRGYTNLSGADALKARAELAYSQADAMIAARKAGA